MTYFGDIYSCVSPVSFVTFKQGLASQYVTSSYAFYHKKFFFVCVSVHILLLTCVSVCTCVCICMCVGAYGFVRMWRPENSLRCCSSGNVFTVSEIVSFTGPEVTKKASPSSQWSPGICWSPPPQSWGYKQFFCLFYFFPVWLAFVMWGSQVFVCWRCLPSLRFCFYDFLHYFAYSCKI